MGGYCGSPNSVMENNKAQRRSTRNQREWKDYIGIKEVETEDYIKASPELLNEIRIKIQNENKKRKKTQIIIAILSFIITIVLLYIITKIEWVGIDLNRVVR